MTWDREITSPSNPRIKEIARLHRRTVRDETGRFLIEGVRELERAVESGVEIELVLLQREAVESGEHRLAQRTGAPVLLVTRAVQAKVSRRQHPASVIGVARAFATNVSTAVDSKDLVLVADSIEKPGNLGAMLRSADATGAGVVVCGRGTDLFSPNVIRASQGSVFSVPTGLATVAEVRAELEARQFQILVATPDGATVYHHLDLVPPTAVVVGSEHAGVSELWLAHSRPVSIPMAGPADSLNASVAAAVILYEAIRQRSSA